MKRILSVTLAMVLVLGLAGAAMAWGPGMGMGMGPGWRMAGGPGGPGPGWGPGAGPGRGPGAGGCRMWGAGPGAGSQGGAAPAAVTEEQARTTATEYVDKYLKGYTVERVLPFTTGRGFTAYQIELKGPGGEARSLHVNPWGGVRPFPAPFSAAR
jgi:hypothetical protein